MENQKEGLSTIREISRIVLVCGIILLIFGINAHNSYSSDISRLFSGSDIDKSILMLVGGAVAAVLGLVGLLRKSRTV